MEEEYERDGEIIRSNPEKLIKLKWVRIRNQDYRAKSVFGYAAVSIYIAKT